MEQSYKIGGHQARRLIDDGTGRLTRARFRKHRELGSTSKGLVRMCRSRQKIRFCASADGTRIAYATSGSGPPLVWVQLWTHHLEYDWDSPVWTPWLSLLARDHTLVRYDWRGCGL